MKKYLVILASVLAFAVASAVASDAPAKDKEKDKQECKACKEKGSTCDACAKKKAESQKH